MRNLKAFLRILAKASRERGMTATQLSKIASTPIAVVKELSRQEMILLAMLEVIRKYLSNKIILFNSYTFV